jgi:hypothetical protein
LKCSRNFHLDAPSILIFNFTVTYYDNSQIFHPGAISRHVQICAVPPSTNNSMPGDGKWP